MISSRTLRHPVDGYIVMFKPYRVSQYIDTVLVRFNLNPYRVSQYIVISAFYFVH